MTVNDLEVSVIIPAHNEAPNISPLLDRVTRLFEKNAVSYEVIVVDDGSQDDTRSVALGYASKNMNVKTVYYDVNRGKGYALRQGFQAAKGSIVVFLDSDLDLPPEQIPLFLSLLRDYDIVVGSKYHPRSNIQIPLSRKILSFFFFTLSKLLIGLNVRDTQTGLKAFHREKLTAIFDVLRTDGFSFDLELLAAANARGLRIVEAPVEVSIKTNYFSLRGIFSMFYDLLSISVKLRCGYYDVEK